MGKKYDYIVSNPPFKTDFSFTEKRVLQMSEELDKQAIEVRNAEKQNLK